MSNLCRFIPNSNFSKYNYNKSEKTLLFKTDDVYIIVKYFKFMI